MREKADLVEQAPSRNTDEAWARYVAASQNFVMAILGEYARQQGLSMRTVAGLARVDIKALQRYFDRAKPRTKTMANVAGALGLEPTVAAALTHTMAERDLQQMRERVAGEIGGASEIFGANADAAAKMFKDATKSGDILRTVAAEWYATMLDVSLAFNQEMQQYEVLHIPQSDPLGVSLAAIDRGLSQFNAAFSLRPLVQDQTYVFRRLREGVNFLFLGHAAMAPHLSLDDSEALWELIVRHNAAQQSEPMRNLEDGARLAALTAYRTYIDTHSNNERNP